MTRIVTTCFQCMLLMLFLGYRNCQLEDGYRCEELRATLCKDMQYNKTILPNFLGHNKQDEALKSTHEYFALIKIKCSSQLRPLLCFMYFPVCTVLMKPIPPCRLLCQQAKTGCEKLMNEFGFNWPAVLDCDKLPHKGLCAGENHTSSADNDVDPDATRKPGGSIWITPPSANRTRILTAPWNGDRAKMEFNDVPVFLLLSSWNKILLYDMSTSDLITLQSGLDQGAAVDFHFSKHWIYWASHGDSRIYRGSLTLDVLRDVKVLVDAAPAVIESLAVDWLSGLVFWLESYPSTIRVASLDGEYPTKILDKELSNPKSLVLDPEEGALFWIDWTGTLYSPNANIEKYDLVTGSHSVIFSITQTILPGMGRPVGLTLDFDNMRLYWVDAKEMLVQHLEDSKLVTRRFLQTDPQTYDSSIPKACSKSETVQSISYSGRDFRVHFRSNFNTPTKNYLSEPCSVGIFKDTIFWTDRTTKTIVKAKKDGNSPEVVMETLTASPPMDMKIFHSHTQPPGIPQYTVELDYTSGSKKTTSKHWTVLFIALMQVALCNKSYFFVS